MTGMSGDDSKIKVMHIIQSPGGVERYIRNFLKYINHEQFHNILICSDNYKRKNYIDCADDFENVNMVREIDLKSDISSIIKVRKLIKKYKPDIVYCHSSKAGAIGRIANFGLKNKCIYNPHGWAFNMGHSEKKKKLYRIIEKILAKLADKIICISGAEQKSALDRKICKLDKLQIINNGIDFSEYDNVPTVTKQEINIPPDAFVIGYVGRLTEQKSPDIFARAAVQIKKNIPNAFFLMVGDGELKEEIQQIYIDNYMEDSYLITGWVENPMSYIKLFDVATLLSRWEGFGLVLAEYMLAEKPIVATSVDAIPYIIQNRKNGLLASVDDITQIYNHVLEIYQDSQLRNRLIQQAKEDVYQLYDAKRMVKEHEKLFLSIGDVGV